MRTAIVAVVLLTVATPAQPATGPVPDFALADLDGTPHTLREQRGKIVVLEWTSHRCPTVVHHYDTGAMQATLATLRRGDRKDLVWWSIDSNQACAGERDAIRAWRADVGHAAPYLLDANGAVGRALGATHTPHLFVLAADGTLAYSGALSDRDEEVNYVEAAVTALRAGRALPYPHTGARGCAIDYADVPPPPLAATQVERPLPSPALVAWDAFQTAAALAAADQRESALAALEASFAAGYVTPADVFVAPAFATLRADEGLRPRLRQLLCKHARETRLTMVAADEPGEAMVLLGLVRSAAGAPLAGALVYAYQTDQRGLYSSQGNDNPRLFAYVRTDADGRFALRTIRPAAYPNQQIEQHVHFEIEAATHARNEQRIGFADDPLWRSRPPEPRPWVHAVERDAGGLSRCSFELQVR